MTKRIHYRIWVLLIALLILYSCQKERVDTTDSNYKIDLIPSVLARHLAQRISLNFLQKQETASAQRFDGSTTGIPNRIIGESITVPDKYDNPALYIFNYTNDSGFVVISADVKHEPICAYVESGKFERDTVPSMYVEWFDATLENIEMVRDGTYDNSDRGNYAWYDLLEQTELTELNAALKPKPVEDPPPSCDEGWVTTIRGPLLATTWGQWCTFNEQAPNMTCTGCFTNPNAPTGCVATAMSQVLRYWAHPNQFNYNYTIMPPAQGNGEVQRMMRDAANSVNMNWGCTGSGANDYRVDNEFKNTFNFSSADGPAFLNQSNYTASSYLTVKSNLNNGWPVILGGYNQRRNRFLGIIYTYSEGHSWVCDGYWATQNHCYGYLRFHMNWGWHEAFGGNDFNGWYAFNNWNPGTRNFRYAQSYIYNIHP